MNDSPRHSAKAGCAVSGSLLRDGTPAAPGEKSTQERELAAGSTGHTLRAQAPASGNESTSEPGDLTHTRVGQQPVGLPVVRPVEAGKRSTESAARVCVGQPDSDAEGRPDEVEELFLQRFFGALLKSEREAAGLTQTELASRAGLAKSTVSRFEAGQRRPRADVIEVLSLVLRPPQRVPGIRTTKFPLDDRAAEALQAQLIEAAGDSIRDGEVTKRRLRRIEQLRRWGMTAQQRKSAQLAKLHARADQLTKQANRQLRGIDRGIGGIGRLGDLLSDLQFPGDTAGDSESHASPFDDEWDD